MIPIHLREHPQHGVEDPDHGDEQKSSTYDLSLVGHTHEFKGSASSKEIVVGNGGAPLSSGTYGFTTIERVAAGWQIQNYDYSTSLPVNTFTIP